ncbi:MAG: leucine-rich repeat protein, partial [Clostridia bacterium]|nr:leucine-rich repeat protein [Clostridia bacterium]
MKKLILALFSLLLIVSISAVATDINGTCDNGISWSVSDGTLTVSGEGEVPNYTRSDTAPWTQYRNEITSIVVEDGITSLGSYCFFSLNNATSISIADSVKYLGLQFIRGTAIEEVSTNAETVVINAFGRADSLKTVRLTESFKNPLGNIFYSETVTVIAPESSYAHRYAELFNSKFKTDATVTYESDGTQASVPVVSLASMGDSVFGAFYKKSDSSWEMVVNGSGKMKNFPYVSPKNELKDYTFCPTYYLAKNNDETKITSIKMLDGVTTVGNYAFYKCTKATGVELPEGITSVGQGAFRGCTRLTSITLPEGVLKIEANAFNGCTNLTSVNIPDSVTEIGKDIFIKCNTDNLTVDTENKMAISYLKESYPELAPEEEIAEDINYETAILLCVNCSDPIIVDGKVSAEHFYASIMIDNKIKSVELNKANAIDGMNCDEAYSTYKLKDKNNDGYVDYAHLLVAYTVNSDGLYTLYTNPESTDETVILDKGAKITYSFTDSCYEINGRKVKTDENSIIYYTFNATSTHETLGCYTKDSLPKYFGEAVSSQPVYLKDNQDGTYTLIATMVSGELEKDTDIFTETVYRVVGTEHFGYNGAAKSGKEDIIRLELEGVGALVNLEDLGLEDYIGNSDALIGLDVLVITKNNEIINTTVLGSVKLAEVSSVGKDDLGFAIIDEVNIDGTVYADAKNSDTLFANLKTLVYGMSTVTTVNVFEIATENAGKTSVLEYPHIALVMDNDGDGVVDSIAIEYYTLG